MNHEIIHSAHDGFEMVKVKTNDLTTIQLNYAVAMLEGPIIAKYHAACRAGTVHTFTLPEWNTVRKHHYKLVIFVLDTPLLKKARRSSDYLYLYDRARMWNPCEDFSQAGPIIEREKIECKWLPKQQEWCCYKHQHHIDSHVSGVGFGPNHLTAAMRCYVSSRFENFVKLPEYMI